MIEGLTPDAVDEAVANTQAASLDIDKLDDSAAADEERLAFAHLFADIFNTTYTPPPGTPPVLPTQQARPLTPAQQYLMTGTVPPAIGNATHVSLLMRSCLLGRRHRRTLRA